MIILFIITVIILLSLIVNLYLKVVHYQKGIYIILYKFRLVKQLTKILEQHVQFYHDDKVDNLFETLLELIKQLQLYQEKK